MEYLKYSNRQDSYPPYFTDKDININNMNDTANKFNTLFTNIGPELAGNIPDTNISINIFNKLNSSNYLVI